MDHNQPSNRQLTEAFQRRFESQAEDIEEQITRIAAASASTGERQDAIEHCLAGISQLSHEVQEASAYIPAYDQRSFSNTIQSLSEKLQEKRESLAPKTKFSFKSARKPGTNRVRAGISAQSAAKPVPGANPENIGSIYHDTARSQQIHTSSSDFSSDDYVASTNASMREDVASNVQRPSFSQGTRILLSDHEGVHIILPSSAMHATGASVLTGLKDCVVDMSISGSSGNPFATLTLLNVEGSLVICGQVSGPLHLTNVRDSTVVVICRQFRMHDCKNVNVYIHASSRPIIEDCNNVRFSPILDFYTRNLDLGVNHWDQVDDFKWLKANPSPHWSVLPESRRISNPAWEQLISKTPGLGVEDLLRAVLPPA